MTCYSRHARVFLAIVAAFLALPGLSSAQSSTGIVIPLIGPSNAMTPHAVSSAGHVVGQAMSPEGEVHAFISVAGGQPVDIAPGPGYTVPQGVNASGTVVGFYGDPEGYQRAFVWTEAGGRVDLGTLGGHYSSAVAINDAGVIAGWANDADDIGHPVRWTAGGIEVIGGITGGPTAINAAGQIFGEAYDENFQSFFFFWSDSTGPLTIKTNNGLSAGVRAMAMNDAGVVVGAFENQAFTWTVKDGMTLLPIVGDQSIAAAINNAGVIAGSRYVGGQ